MTDRDSDTSAGEVRAAAENVLRVMQYLNLTATRIDSLAADGQYIVSGLAVLVQPVLFGQLLNAAGRTNGVVWAEPFDCSHVTVAVRLPRPSSSL
jgi:hypothetical protein